MRVQSITITGALAACGIAGLASAQTAVIDARGLVTAAGTDAAEAILVSQVADQIVVNVGGNAASFAADKVQEVTIDARGGNDTITVNVNRPTTIRAGAGNDTIIGSDGGNDVALGQQGADTFSGRGGDDTFIWDPGDGNDIIDGDAGRDTHIFNGSPGNEIMTVAPNGARIRLTRDLGNIVMDIGSFENITVNALGGDDTVSGAVGVAALVNLFVLDGGAGNDILKGGDGNDSLLGGDGDDTVDGNGGVDTALLGAGDDVFIWDPGDASDVVEGEAGFDSLLFNGSSGSEIFDASAVGPRLRFFCNLGNIVMDMGTTEQIDLRAFEGDDVTTIHDLTGTGVTDVLVDAGPGNDVFAGSALPESFFGGPGDDTATMGGSDFLDMGGGNDALRIFGTASHDSIHIDARTDSGHDEALVFGSLGHQRAVFDHGEVVIVITQGGGDNVKMHKAARRLWELEFVD